VSTGKLRHRSERHDQYYERAKRDGFAARSIYKLQEIDRKHHLLRRSQRVLDLGCWPGSWLQYAAQVVGPSGVLVGIDRFPLEVALPPPGVRQVVGDVFQVDPQELRGALPGFDVVLSDMAPDTTGVRSSDQARSEALFERALDLGEALLLPGGGFVGKLFQGPEWNALLRRCRALFSEVKQVKPEGTRRESIEQYVVGLSRRL
jgi:23S rRNA (uridine2552-2'-O)-methyltransferase